ncbi:MAG: GGDEF domain-containing protein [Sulfuricurvum sp.]|uniref:sensor domain-containing diguanylate cyclase n=1 Tax=Sulfuricurvum sp. TaxID=2025608 RepID=UPI0025FD3D30|nr:GGDEF domain-containing protein [Sulfuricurvum sp.]MBV5321251.1 GGDEF domain-containing protein [Sulfuricurvum sp.]
MKKASDIKRFGSFVKQVVALSAIFGITIFGLYWIMVSQSNQNPVKDQTKQTGRMIFTMYYTAMQNGWGKHEIDTMTERINDGQKNLHVKLYRGPLVDALYGKREGQSPFEMMNQDEMELFENGMIHYHYTIKFEQTCLKCHTNAKVGEGAGMLELVFPMGEFWVSSTYVFKIIVAIFIVTLFSISFVLYIMLKRQFINPLDNFVDQVDSVVTKHNLRKEIVLNTSIAELDHLKNVFNKIRGELADSFESIQTSAEVDELTGAYNRLKLNQVLAQYGQSHLSASIILFDLDKFKPINDTYGHDVGDEVLKRFVSVVRQNLKGRDYLFRIGGDEFMALLPNTSTEDAGSIARQIDSELLNTPCICENGIITIECSYGIAYSDDTTHTFNELFRSADQSMFSDKKAKDAAR